MVTADFEVEVEHRIDRVVAVSIGRGDHARLEALDASFDVHHLLDAGLEFEQFLA